jgi:hypothetical protein
VILGRSALSRDDAELPPQGVELTVAQAVSCGRSAMLVSGTKQRGAADAAPRDFAAQR